MQNRHRLTDTENRLRVTEGQWGGETGVRISIYT